MSAGPLGVGFIGAGPVTQAIHLPTLATLYDRFRVVHVMDVDAEVAAAVAARTGARSGTDLDTLLADPAVDVVAVCSPHQFHADQVEAAARAGTKAILCEKPLATTVEQARRIAEVSEATGVPVIVGAMHVHDPAYVAATRAWERLPEQASLVRVEVYLPANDDLVELATDLVAAPPPARSADMTVAANQAAAVRAGILGLATHNLPHVRRFLPKVERVLSAAFLPPFGYELTFHDGPVVAQLLALMPGQWAPHWRLHVHGPDSELHVAFPPSYVLAGSSTASLDTAASSTRWSEPRNGYQAEWSHLADVVAGRARPAPVRAAVDDLVYALELADGADALILEES